MCLDATPRSNCTLPTRLLSTSLADCLKSDGPGGSRFVAIAVWVALSGCVGESPRSSDEDQATESSASAAVSVVASQFSDSVANRAATTATTPDSATAAEDDPGSELARYDLVQAVGYLSDERSLVNQAWRLVFSRCMSDAGFDGAATAVAVCAIYGLDHIAANANPWCV